MARTFQERLQRGIVLADGAMGTQLYERGVRLDECFEAINLHAPHLVLEIHRAYILAGAELIETNTFGANRFKLANFGLADRVREINRTGVRLAREAREICGVPVFVAGAVGPTGRLLEPYGTVAPEAVRDAFREQIEALLEGGVDVLVFETMNQLAEIREAIAAAREVCDLPIVAQMTFAADGRTLAGHSPEEVIEALAELGVSAVGVNCSVGPRPTVAILQRMAAVNRWGLPLSAMPNAGWPTNVGGRVIFGASPDYFADFAREVRSYGVRLVGGCCGTTPAHIAAMRRALDHDTGQASLGVSERQRTDRSVTEVPSTESPTRLAQKLGKAFVISVEIDPPKGLSPVKAIDGARLLREVGVEFINVADSPMARVRMSALALCVILQQEAGVETILHLTTRDRNLMGLQSDLLGAHALGVRNILALTGDPPTLGDYPQATPVYDVDSIGLVRILQRFRQGIDVGGASIGRPAAFTIGVACDPTRSDLDHEIERLHAKLEAGADFIMTQPVFSFDTWRSFVTRYEERYGPIRVPVLLGVLPLQSYRHAVFLHNEVPGITLTETALERMRRAGPNGRSEGVAMARELIAEAYDFVDGIYLMPSFGRYEVVAEVLEALPKQRFRARAS
ncbi:bifunctional homocysteine S-methyltransferase/methylenetetrahydrofolate reductase [Thermomicrobium sp. 4228-Ro]|uniref:bifunctional homocysteine S-methyltransferase/methylenetetrahydrofolate reductase n=1 Tax=Thermomicrobium sp. 4228-Ro TaxID=2993937 RepID=UPI002248C7EE|nr:bifunctional homocysteine S-methyltransferase/methylenetetrahydrofolate reductase [Thermomicrobium sp. 4228-Ro]MCX2727676.1 bifunctional homocysteine S-methyltransferase/methylenetetrahydrofolate reductase [Thermomicrobium sp. 4228-Ro]